MTVKIVIINPQMAQIIADKNTLKSEGKRIGITYNLRKSA